MNRLTIVKKLGAITQRHPMYTIQRILKSDSRAICLGPIVSAQ